MLLADLGAEVIKIERPRPRRRLPRLGAAVPRRRVAVVPLSVNRNKRSVTLDYTGDAGRAVLHDLVRKCRRRARQSRRARAAQARRRLRDACAALKPDLVYVSLTGFGLDGARADLPCYDLIAEGYCGVMDLTGEADERAAESRHAGGRSDRRHGRGVSSALAALFDRGRTGRGHAIDVSMVDSMTRFMAPRIVPYLGSGDVPAAHRRARTA